VADKYQIVAAKVARQLMEENNDMQNHMLLEVVEALEKGEDVDNGLASIVFTHSFMEKFIDELLRYEE
jgi:hypothetical protein